MTNPESPTDRTEDPSAKGPQQARGETSADRTPSIKPLGTPPSLKASRVVVTPTPPRETETTEPEDPDKAVKPERLLHAIRAETVSGIAHNAGTAELNSHRDPSLQATTVNGIAQNLGPAYITNLHHHSVSELSFEHDLWVLTFPPPAPDTPVPEGEVSRYTETLIHERLLVIRHAPAHHAAALSAMRSIVLKLREREPARPVATSGSGRPFPLYSFSRNTAWPDGFRHTLVYLDRSQDVTAADFLITERMGLLREVLTREDAYLLLKVSDPAASTAAAAQPGNWIVQGSAPGSEPPPDILPAKADAFESAVVLCATLFPGMAPAEFAEVVELFAPRNLFPAQIPQSAANPAVTSDSAAPQRPAPPSPPSREQRWRAGERDGVLQELGVWFGAADEPGMQDHPPGLRLRDVSQRNTAPALLVARFPILLTQHLPSLTDRYFFGPTASAAYRREYVSLLFRLEGNRCFRVTSDWLLQCFRSVSARDAGRQSTRAFAELMVRALDRREGESLVDSVITALATWVTAEERALLRSFPTETVEAALQAATAAQSQDADATGAFWSHLGTVDAPRVESLAKLTRQVWELLLHMSPQRPHAVQTAACALLSDASPGARPPGLAAGTARSDLPVARLPRLPLQAVMSQVLSWDPVLWSAFAAAIVVGSTDANARDKSTDTPQIPLAHDCLIALIPLLHTEAPQPFPDKPYEVLFSDSQRRKRTGEILGQLLQRADLRDSERLDVTFILWMYSALMLALLVRPGAVDSEVSATLIDLIVPLSAGLKVSERSALIRRARDVQDLHLIRRDYFVRQDQREALRIERQRLKAVQTVLRGLSSPSPSVLQQTH